MSENCERCGGGIRHDVLKTVRGKHYHAICEPLDSSPAEIAATEVAMAQVRETWPKEDTATLSTPPGTPLEIAIQALKDVANPRDKFRRECPEGHVLDGMWVIRLEECPGTYRNIAEKALAEIEVLEKGQAQ